MSGRKPICSLAGDSFDVKRAVAAAAIMKSRASGCAMTFMSATASATLRVIGPTTRPR